MSDRLASSYRDPSGFIFTQDQEIYRQINPIYFDEYTSVKNSGVYEELFEKGWLVKHIEVSATAEKIILKPEQLPFITYPYEWSFTQYKHAAQLTLRIQLLLLERGFSLKDASAFNVTFHHGKALFIDTLSIEKYVDNSPWRALEQFNKHFFAPLLLSQKYGAHHLKILQQHIDGQTLSQTAAQLSWKTRFHPVIYPHIHLLAKTEAAIASTDKSSKTPSISKAAQIKMLKVLEMHIGNMKLNESTEWSAYYHQTNYEQQAFELKKKLVHEWCDEINTTRAIDLGGNDGTFASVLPNSVHMAIVSDIDQSAINQCYTQQLKATSKRLIPMVTDLMQPAPSIGWNNKERDSFIKRVQQFKPDVSLALALIHHITLTGNVPFDMSAAFFASMSEYLLIEFPDKEDSWVQYILESKRDARHLFEDYGVSAFAKAYSQQFSIIKEEKIEGTHRTLYMMQRK
ncbi:class I SAM-dependent methyltransferase [Nonlabens ponticola]|uniref:Class I SAM-dependent methyltransferase n=1 Tax=Nonlabens ponticola TaxID=2496866 RepID=A0A3S9MU88_9FLAO|nr:class I SAM-dependent methyltransferase [Nonlabens ponticola]AZQ42742.1 class I SAM-dependent methyltransferase [Nonlabens ponticola]